MASIKTLVCDHCGHEHTFISNKTYVILEDGSEKRWPEPGGFSLGAKTLTGETRKWSELRKNGDIISHYPLVCLSCGNMDYYGPHELNVVTPSKSHLGSIVNQVSRGVLNHYECRSCGQKSLQPLARYAGFTRYVLSWAGIKRWNLDCKHCGEGKYIPELASIT